MLCTLLIILMLAITIGCILIYFEFLPTLVFLAIEGDDPLTAICTIVLLNILIFIVLILDYSSLRIINNLFN